MSALAFRPVSITVRTLPVAGALQTTCRFKSGTCDLNHQRAAVQGKYKSIEELPGPSLATTAHWLFIKGYADRSHAMQLTDYSTQLLIQSLFLSHLDYCNSLLADLPATTTGPLQLIQNSAARLGFSLPRFAYTAPLLCSLHRHPIPACIQFKTLNLTYSCLDHTAPSYLQSFVSPYIPFRPLRSSGARRLTLPPFQSPSSRVEHKKLYGPIWRSRFGPFEVVNVATADLIAQVIRQEGKYPVRTHLPHWKEYRDLRGQAYGLHVDTGPEWHRIRSVLNPKMLKLREVSAYSPVINEVVSDLLRRIYRLRQRSPDGTKVINLAEELYKFGFEGISSILFETRLRCLDDDVPQDTQKFIKAAGEMLTLSETVLFFPQWTRAFLPFWQRFVQAWDDLYNVAQKLIDQKVKDINGMVKKGEVVEGMYLTSLLSCRKLSLREIYISITELLLGGVDTVSSVHINCYLLQTWKQSSLKKVIVNLELRNKEQNGIKLTHVQLSPCFVHSSFFFRLYPVVPGNGRLTVDNEVVVDNYLFPKMTQFHLCHYAASHDESEFPNAENSIPFGVGVRACLGKRVAELEMYFALSRLMQHFEVRAEAGAKDIKPKTRTLMIPRDPIHLHFISRK
ncbi:CP27A protein, partial [Amia calva]|nr:CP27A protein [Amia calva]